MSQSDGGCSTWRVNLTEALDRENLLVIVVDNSPNETVYPQVADFTFYAYKAWLSDDPFVHLCGKRYIDRVEAVTKVTVYSNQTTVELFTNGVSPGIQEAADHFFYFEVPNMGQTHLVAVSGQLRDESLIRKVEVFNEAYRLREKNAIPNWFDITEPEGYFSRNDKIGDIMGTLKGKMLFMGLIAKFMPKKGEKRMGGFELSGSMMDMLGGFTVLRLSGMIGTMSINLTKEYLLSLNAQLNKMKKPKNNR